VLKHVRKSSFVDKYVHRIKRDDIHYTRGSPTPIKYIFRILLVFHNVTMYKNVHILLIKTIIVLKILQKYCSKIKYTYMYIPVIKRLSAPRKV